VAKPNIKKFRHEIAVLKRKGLVTGVDARSVTPTKKLTNLIDRFDDVLSGKATPVKLSKTETKNLKDAGYDVYKGRVLFPHSAGEKVSVSHGHAKTRNPKGVEHVTIPVPFHKLEDYIKQIKRNSGAIDSMKRRDEYFAFRFYGHQSQQLFRDIDLLIDYLQQPSSGSKDPILNRNQSSRDMNEAYRNLEIVKVHRARDWEQRPRRMQSKLPEKEIYKRAKAKRAKSKRLTTLYNANNAAKQQQYRDTLTTTEKQAYRKAAAKRAAKSRRKHAKGKKRK
jgi:hypothetical protein